MEDALRDAGSTFGLGSLSGILPPSGRRIRYVETLLGLIRMALEAMLVPHVIHLIMSDRECGGNGQRAALALPRQGGRREGSLGKRSRALFFSGCRMACRDAGAESAKHLFTPLVLKRIHGNID